MAQSEVGRTIAEIKQRSGVSWDALARRLGASSGDYVRKVASGSKPGNNLATAVDELMSTGRVTQAPERRTTKSGQLARVRASKSTGAPSRIPEQQKVDVTQRAIFPGKAGRLGWSEEHAMTNIEAIRAAIRSAGRGRKRVSFRVTIVDTITGREAYVSIGQNGGYRPRDVLPEASSAASFEAWLWKQMARRTYAPKNGEIEGVEVIVE